MKRFDFPVYFNHVPKCAGTSLNELLSRGLRRDQLGVEPFMPAMELYTIPGERLDRLAFVASHLPHWAARRRIPDWTRLTVLREPWSRFQALCRHLLRVQYTEPNTVMTAVGFLRKLREGRYKSALTEALAWYPNNASAASYFLPDPLYEGTPFPEDAADMAIKALCGYDVVLLTERLADDALLLDRVLNGQSFGAAARLNSAELNMDDSSGPFPEEYASAFATRFAYEAELFAAAQERYAQSREWLQGECEAGRFGPRVLRLAPPPLFSLDWELPTCCGGFSDRLVAQSVGFNGRVARRIEAGIGVLEFDLPPTDRARIEAVFWIAPPDSRWSVRITLNGHPLSFFDPSKEVRPPVDDQQIWTWAELPVAAARNGRCRLLFDRRDAPELTEFWVLDFVVRTL